MPAIALRAKEMTYKNQCRLGAALAAAAWIILWVGLGLAQSNDLVVGIQLGGALPTFTGDTVDQGQNIGLMVLAIGDPPLSYQWYLNASNALPLQTNAVLWITNAGPGDAGCYSVVVSNAVGMSTSPPVPITVLSNAGAAAWGQARPTKSTAVSDLPSK